MLAKLFDLFNVDIDTIWSKSGFLHCTNMNYLMKILLLGSLKFDEKDIEFRWTLIHCYSPHEYLRIRVRDKEWLDIDLWGKVYGIKFGSHAHGFNSGRMKVIN